ncbi:hypothetical protein [Amycolatopsis anabasis]|uniref:hypothetical protein n=1 Tax=Amycolatopsis anabasis TaxID=1840409 RepID=UPI00131B1BD7|nr:hypothetical protein [Amycolatopsis anabasis]
MDHGTHVSSGSAGVDLAALLIRLVLLLGTAFVAGTGLLRPFVTEVPRGSRLLIGAVSALSAALAVVSIFVLEVNVVGAVLHAVLTLAVPVLLGRASIVRWPALALVLLVVIETSLGRSGVEFAVDTVYVAGAVVWFGIAVLSFGARWTEASHRLRALAWALGVLLALAGLLELGLSGVAFDRRLYETAFGWALLATVLLPIAVTVVAALTARRSRAELAYRYGVAGVAVGFLAWSALVAIPRPPELPIPGVPLLADAAIAGHEFPVLVSPQRPGRNLVHFPAGAGEGLTVGVEGGLFAPAIARPGAQGSWAEVDLPPGRSDLLIDRGGARTSVEVDAGEEAAGPVTAAGADGPECASAALGGLIAGRKDPLAACPADALADEDADALRKLVGFLGGRGVRTIVLAEDPSPRGTAAAAVVRAAAAQRGIGIGDGPDSALVAVTGWADGYTAMARAAEAQREAPAYPYGLYLAPWLLNGPIVNAVTSSSLPLRFHPREQLAVSYTVAAANAFGGESPSVGGFRSWLGAQAKSVSGEVQIYASAQVNAMPMNPREPHAPGMPMIGDGAGQWIPNGTVVPVSLPLEQ